MIVEAESIAAGSIARVQVDMVVLATGMVPSTAGRKIPIAAAAYDEDGFFLDGPGIYGAGCVKRPSDVASYRSGCDRGCPQGDPISGGEVIRWKRRLGFTYVGVAA